MPLIQVSIRAGRGPVAVRRLITALTDAAADALDAPRETVRVIVTEVAEDHWANGGVTLAEQRARPV